MSVRRKFFIKLIVNSFVNLKNIRILKFDIHFSSNVCGWVCHICLPVSNDCNKLICCRA